jgi:glycosyltransferase involved in cell wall biosynthesis
LGTRADTKILHVCESIQGGIATYLDELAPLQIAEFGANNVRFVVPSRSRPDLPNVPNECLIGIDYDRRSARNLLRYAGRVRRIIAEERPTLVHAHSTFAGAASRLLRAAGLAPVPIVYCAHGWSFLMDVRERKKRIYTAAERWLSRYTDAIVHISRHEHDRALRIGIPANKSFLIFNGIGNTLPAPRIDLPRNRINLLFAGRLDRQKGSDIILDAMARLRDVEVHLYVAGDAVHGNAERPILPNVTYLGWVSRDVLDSYYSAVDALVMPSRWEGFGLAAVEAMRQSTAVLASAQGALPEIVISRQTGLLCPSNDPAVWADLLRGLNKAELQRWGQEALERQRQLFSIDRVHSQLCDVYEAVGRSAQDAAR